MTAMSAFKQVGVLSLADSSPHQRDNRSSAPQGLTPRRPSVTAISSKTVWISSLAAWTKYLHPQTGAFRVNSSAGAASNPADNAQRETVEHLVIDIRYVIALDEYPAAGPTSTTSSRCSATKRSSGSTPSVSIIKKKTKNIILPNVNRITIRGAEYVESTEGRAHALGEVLKGCTGGVLDVQWLNGDMTQTSGPDHALTFQSHLVHPEILDAGAQAWGDQLQDDIGDSMYTGLKRLIIQGGFPMPNPSSSSSSICEKNGLNPEYKLQPDFRFAFSSWIKLGGIEILGWNFKGPYTAACSLSILKRLFEYISTTYESTNAGPCGVLVLDHLHHSVVTGLGSRDAEMMKRVGLDSASSEVIEWLEDCVFIAEDEGMSRVWSSEPQEEDERQIRRFKADVLAIEEHGRLRPKKIIPSSLSFEPISRRSSVASIARSRRTSSTHLTVPASPLSLAALEQHDRETAHASGKLSVLSPATNSTDTLSPSPRLQGLSRSTSHTTADTSDSDSESVEEKSTKSIVDAGMEKVDKLFKTMGMGKRVGNSKPDAGEAGSGVSIAGAD